jgi:hypothetical protein
MGTFLSVIRFVARLFLIVISVFSGLLGAYGLYVFITKKDSLISFIYENGNKWFFTFQISNISIGDLLTKYTKETLTNIWLPIIFVIVGSIAWITQVGLGKRQIYRRIRFAHLGGASPLAWIMVFAGVAATVYVAANWNSIDHTVAALVILANIIAILWNLSLIR